MGSNFDWSAWGKLDLSYGVAAIPGKSRGSARPWTDEAFYELGRRDWDAFRPHWEQYGVSRASCLEIGCGAGRLTAHLARYFLSVDVVDVSPEMVDYARQHAGLDGVRFHVTDGVRLPLVENSVSAVFSAHALRPFSSTAAALAVFLTPRLRRS
jgi:SAM-dependent methyltransferase